MSRSLLQGGVEQWRGEASAQMEPCAGARIVEPSPGTGCHLKIRYPPLFVGRDTPCAFLLFHFLSSSLLAQDFVGGAAQRDSNKGSAKQGVWGETEAGEELCLCSRAV